MFAIANDSPNLYLSDWDTPEGKIFIIISACVSKKKNKNKELHDSTWF